MSIPIDDLGLTVDIYSHAKSTLLGKVRGSHYIFIPKYDTSGLPKDLIDFEFELHQKLRNLVFVCDESENKVESNYKEIYSRG